MTISANVRKKGRPRFLDAGSEEIWRNAFPDRSYRQRCNIQKYAEVWKVLMAAAGEAASVSTLAPDAKTCRPKTFKRFPWLLGNKIQHVVLAELYGMPSEGIVVAADYIERKHRKNHINAKEARQMARDWKMVSEADRQARTAAGT